MMRAWAAISAAAVLVALPVSVPQAAGGVTATGAPAPVANGGSEPLTSAGLGVLLWLAVAGIAVAAAFLVLRYTSTHLDPLRPAVTPVTPSGSGTVPVRSDAAGSAATANGR